MMTQPPALNPDEEAICECVSANCMQLHEFVDAFAQSVNLFELLERGGGGPETGVFGGPFIHYRIIAAREGGLNIFHFGCSLEALRKQVMLCPRSRNVELAQSIKAAYKLFCFHFPNANNTRHGIAHAGEKYKSPRIAKEHVQKLDYKSAGGTSTAGGSTPTMLFGRTYSIGWEGQMFEVQMDHSTTNKLVEVMTLALEKWTRPNAA